MLLTAFQLLLTVNRFKRRLNRHPFHFLSLRLCSHSTSSAGARFSKDPVTTGPDNLPGRLTGNFTGPGIAFLEAPVNFPGIKLGLWEAGSDLKWQGPVNKHYLRTRLTGPISIVPLYYTEMTSPTYLPTYLLTYWGPTFLRLQTGLD